MALYKTEGIVFRNLKYSDTSLIVDIYTKDKGLKSYIVSGSRATKSNKKAQFFQLFNIIEIVAYDGQEEKLCHIKEVSASYHYKNLYSDVKKSSIATFMLEVARNTIREKEGNEILYQFLIDSFVSLDKTKEKTSDFHLKFMLDLSAHAGFYPQLPSNNTQIIFDVKNGEFVIDKHTNEFSLNEECSKTLIQLMNTPFEDIHQLQIAHNVRYQLLDSLLLFFTYHLEGFRAIKSLDVLRMILS